MENSGNPMRFFALAFFVLNMGLSAFFVDTWLTPNPVSRALPVLTLFNEATLKIDSYEQLTIDKAEVRGHYYSDKAPLASFLVAPVYGLLKACGLDRWGPAAFPSNPAVFSNYNYEIRPISRAFDLYPVLVLGSLLCGTLPFAVILQLTFVSIRCRPNGICPVLLSCFSFYGCYLFVYSGVFFGHLLAGLFLLLAYRLVLERRYFLSGILLGTAFVTEYTLAVVFPVWLLVIALREKRFRPCAAFGLGMSPAVLANSLYTAAITGDPFKMVYGYVSHPDFARMRDNMGFGLPKLGAVWDLLFSQYQGLLFFAPVLLIGLAAMLKYRTFDWRQFLQSYLAPISVVFVAFVSSYYMWWGGWAYGPRHLIPLAVLLVYESVRLISANSVNAGSFFAVTSFGILCSWLAKATIVFYVPEQFKQPLFEFILPEFSRGRINPNNLLTVVWGVEPAAAAWIWLLSFGGVVTALSLWHRRIQSQRAPHELPGNVPA